MLSKSFLIMFRKVLFTQLNISISTVDETSSKLPVTHSQGASLWGADSNFHWYNCFLCGGNIQKNVSTNNIKNNNFVSLEELKYIHMNMEYLDNINYDNTIPFVPPIVGGKVVKVYDGDTFTLASKLPNTDVPIYRFSLRLKGIDTPEIKGKTQTEKELAKKSRDALSGLIMNKIVRLENISIEKYGRILADVFVDNICVNEYMIDNKYAVKYDGGTKERPDEWN